VFPEPSTLNPAPGSRGEACLVHCHSGVSRSATVRPESRITIHAPCECIIASRLPYSDYEDFVDCLKMGSVDCLRRVGASLVHCHSGVSRSTV